MKEVTFELKSDFIELAQLLKAAGVTDSGAEAKLLVQDGGVLVNGEPESRRGRKLRQGDTVELPGTAKITLA